MVCPRQKQTRDAVEAMMVAIGSASKKGRKRPPGKRTQIKKKIGQKSAWTKLPVAGPGGKAKGRKRKNAQRKKG